MMLGQMCKRKMPCLADIYVFAGVDPPCEVCEAHIDEMRHL